MHAHTQAEVISVYLRCPQTKKANNNSQFKFLLAYCVKNVSREEIKMTIECMLDQHYAGNIRYQFNKENRDLDE